MLSLTSIVYFILFLLGAGAVFGLLFYLISYGEKKFPEANPNIFKFAHIALVILGVLFLIGVILDFLGHPLVNWRS